MNQRISSWFIRGIPEETKKKLLLLDAVSKVHSNNLVFMESDYAVEYMEGLLLSKYADESPERSIEDPPEQDL